MFFGRIADPRDVLRMFELTPDTFVFVKDEEGRFMAANRATCARCGASNESELIGSTDEKFLHPEIARSYREDDKRVFRTGKAIVNRLELFYDEQRRLDWFLTTKLPLRDQRGRVIGVMGMTRRAEQRTMHESVREVVAAVDFAREHCNHVSTTAEMADALCLS
ncbi:aerobic respiration control sensor protein ArcB [Stieleria maiorica]|uniref:Aerobic respiration control sensor protein ArcB n=2 Tax=Stieleria maiorica TaxID=2795974 RepID=A0A5B9MFX0_9BACT|nr:aerobic respiration control sensor protein ArcB [Stieleria maiorica]